MVQTFAPPHRQGSRVGRGNDDAITARRAVSQSLGRLEKMLNDLSQQDHIEAFLKDRVIRVLNIALMNVVVPFP